MKPQLLTLYGEEDQRLGIAPIVAAILKGAAGAVGGIIKGVKGARQRKIAEANAKAESARVAQLEQQRLLEIARRRSQAGVIALGAAAVGAVVILRNRKAR
ncbi:MAG TPA: hypothetical protein VLH56_19610 [Dissulfurispiraceae bacterium]|nr:hypothetical protein [Dissulfurispiraceae bacterium]